jgi:hypothetical protein
MRDLTERVRTRLFPALLTAFGVTFLAIGLLSYGSPVDAGPLGSPPPSSAVVLPSETPRLTLPPLATPPPPTASPTFPADRVATRVRIAALKIDLPVVAPPPPPNDYPLCDVAMYLGEPLKQPGEGGATYLFAHAREGMFLPILTASLTQNGKKMLGMVVEVWTSDDKVFLYEVTEVRRHQLDLDDAVTATTEEVWLQTSEGPKGTPGKTQVIADYLSQEEADPAEAHPTPKPVVCG